MYRIRLVKMMDDGDEILEEVEVGEFNPANWERGVGKMIDLNLSHPEDRMGDYHISVFFVLDEEV